MRLLSSRQSVIVFNIKTKCENCMLACLHSMILRALPGGNQIMVQRRLTADQR